MIHAPRFSSLPVRHPSQRSPAIAIQIFVNRPVKDLPRSVGFFAQLGFTLNQQFTNENAACMIVSEDIFVKLPGPVHTSDAGALPT